MCALMNRPVSEETPHEADHGMMTITLPTSDPPTADEAVTLTVKLGGQVHPAELLYLGERVNEA